jgi:hypothetical protein
VFRYLRQYLFFLILFHVLWKEVTAKREKLKREVEDIYTFNHDTTLNPAQKAAI